ncbi:MAG: TetR/AcrR family transcriptional regulator [Planctomycetota bacterium]
MKRDETERTAYHHGDLRRELLLHAVELLDDRGIEGFSLREVARRASVAPAAPSHHFGNVTGLLTAVAADGFQRLVAEFETLLRKKRSPERHVVALCEAYVKHHRASPGVFSIMFRRELLDDGNETLNEFKPKSLQLLIDSVRNAIPDATPDKQVHVAKILWATMHGLVTLRLDDSDELSSRVAFAARTILAGAAR